MRPEHRIAARGVATANYIARPLSQAPSLIRPVALHSDWARGVKCEARGPPIRVQVGESVQQVRKLTPEAY